MPTERRTYLPLVAVLVAALAGACSTAPRKAHEILERQVRFVCSNGEEVEMRFLPPQDAAVLVRHGMPIELQRQRSATGFVYSNGPNTVRSKGDELTVEIGRMAPLQCKAAVAGGNAGAAAR